MKVDQDLRIAIKAAAGCSKNQSSVKDNRELIEAWLKKFTKKAARARALIKVMEASDRAEQKAREQLEKQFGLCKSHWHGHGEFCLADEKAFVSAGGEQATKLPKFDENQVITEYAAAKTPGEAAKVLAKYGIVWK